MDDDGSEAVALHRWAVIAEAASRPVDTNRTGRGGAGHRGAPAHASRRLGAPLQPGQHRPLDPGLAQGRPRSAAPRDPLGHRGGAGPPRARRRGGRPASRAAQSLGRPDRPDPLRPSRDRRPRAHGAGPAGPPGPHPRGARRRAQGLRPLRSAAPNDRWITDVLIGPWVPHPKTDSSVRAKLFLIVDDHSRLLVHGRFFAHENARACPRGAAPGHRAPGPARGPLCRQRGARSRTPG